MSSSKENGRSIFASSLRFALRYWQRQPLLTGGLVLAMLTTTGLELFVPVLAGQLTDGLMVEASQRAALLPALLGLVGLIVLTRLVAILFHTAGYFGIISFTLRMMGESTRETFARVQRLSSDWHASTFAGSTVRKISRGMWALDLMNDTILLAFVPALVVLVGTTALFAWRWPLAGLIIVIGAAVYLAILILMALRVMAPAAKISNFWDTKLGGMLADSISCSPVVKGFGGEAREDGRIAWVVGRWQARSSRLWQFGTLNGVIQQTMLVLLRGAVLTFVVWQWSLGRASPGDVTFALTAYAMIDGYLREIGHHVRNLQKSVNDMDDMVKLHAAPMGVMDKAVPEHLAVGHGEIRFERVGFHYGDHARPLYSDLDITIPAGQKLALVGHSGSGKTTFVKLVQRLYDVTGGRILIDGHDVRDVAQESLRRQIAVVQQEPILFHRSLAENIAYGRPDATMAEIIAAARRANAHDFIEKLPKGYGTLVGERGVKLSGGERQRVAIARAFLADAPILILDEATSSLDAESEAAVQDAIERLMQGRTTIVIAHRLSTVRAMDRLLVFDAGQVVEDGDHAALMASAGGIYRRLFERQMRAMADEITG